MFLRNVGWLSTDYTAFISCKIESLCITACYLVNVRKNFAILTEFNCIYSHRNCVTRIILISLIILHPSTTYPFETVQICTSQFVWLHVFSH
jgi:hypothetical protein